jgi:phospholipase/lecithinase/hemolysin
MAPDLAPLARTRALIWRGIWNEKASYNHPDAVTERGLNYVAINPNVGIHPATDNGSSWRLLAGPGSRTRTVIFYLGDSLLDNGSCNYLNGGKGDAWASNGPTWGPVANEVLGLPCVPRWTPKGSIAGQLGTNYAVAGAAISSYITPVNTSLLAQISKLLADYPGGLPANSLVVIFIGNNDVGVSGTIPAGGGIWSDAHWKTTAPFKVPPAAGAALISVETSTGAIAGLTNYAIVRTSSGVYGPYPITGVPNGSHLIIQNPFGIGAGANIPSQSIVQVYASWFLHEELVMLSSRIANLLSAGAKIIWTNLEKITLLPIFTGSQSGLSDTSVAYWNSTAESLIHAGSVRNIELFDIASVYQDMCVRPTQYGFKDAVTPWNNSATIDPDDLVFYDSAHLTAAAHRFIAKRFLEMLHRRGLVTAA